MIIKKRYLIIFIAFLLLSLSIFLVVNKPSNKKVKSGPIKIGLSMDSIVGERRKTDRDAFMSKVKELGGEVIVQNSGEDSAVQISQIKYLIAQGVDVLVILPNDSDALAPVVATAKEKGIKVISYDKIIKSGNVDLHLTFNNVAIGQFMAEGLTKKVPQGNYIIIDGDPKDYNAIELNQGFKNVLAPLVKSGKINIINEVWAQGWKADEAYKAVEASISNGQKFDAIIAGNDALAATAIKSLSDHKLGGKVTVVGQDADLAGCQRVVEGLQLQTIYKPIVTLAKSAAESAMKLAKGEKLKTTGTMNDGSHTITIISVNCVAVNKDNMVDVVVKNDFHKLEEIYSNVPKALWPK